jgi:glycosyltransferase involved in cell wall biosynthesis
MKIAYAAIFDPEDPLVWSGTENRVYKGLQLAGHEVIPISNLHHGRSIGRAIRKWCARTTKKQHLHFWDLDTAQDYANDIVQRLSDYSEVDCIVSTSLVPLAFLDSKYKAYVWTDATFVGLRQDYEEFSPSRLSGPSYRHALSIDRLNVERATKVVLSSLWAEESLRKEHPKADVSVIPFGANYDITSIRIAEPRYSIVLTFLAVRWHEKGGDKAFAVFSRLTEIYANVELNIVGCVPPRHVTDCLNVKVWGFVNKFTESGRQLFESIMNETDYVIVPTIAEAFGMFAAEAAAFGTIVLTNNVGGLSTVVVNQETGFTFDIDDSIDVWVSTVVRLENDLKLKAKIGASARRRYDTLLNWDTAITSFTQLIESNTK